MIEINNAEDRVYDPFKMRYKMFHEIGLILEDTNMLEEIGDMDYLEFCKHLYECYEPLIQPGKRLWKINGHRIALIKYYCETFNVKGEE